YMWWWVFTRPGMTTWSPASITSSASPGSCALGPTDSITPSRANRPPPGISRRAASCVTSRVAFFRRSVAMAMSLCWRLRRSTPRTARVPENSRVDIPLDFQQCLAAQRRASLARPEPSLAERRADLDRLAQLLKDHREALVEAICKDYGNRSAF